MLFITAFVQEVCVSRAPVDIAVNFAVFILGLIFLLLHFFFGGALTLCLLIFSTAAACVVGGRFIVKLRGDPQAKPNFRRMIALCAFVLFVLVSQMRVDYVRDMLWVWALIPAAVLLPIILVAIFLPLKKVWKDIFPTKGNRIFSTVCLVLLMFGAALTFSAIFLRLVNEVFDGEPQKQEYTVLEKEVYSGSRTPTRFEVKVLIDNKERWITVYVTDYHEIEEGDTVILDYYSGALNFAYYYYYGKA